MRSVSYSFRIDASVAPTEAQMKLAIAQTLSLPFAYNAPVVVLRFVVAEDGSMTGEFKDAARPRVFSFELNRESVSYRPFKPGRMDGLDSEDRIIEWEEFSAGYSYRVDAGIGKGKKPQCTKPTSYNCGNACINIMKSCKAHPKDPEPKDRLKNLNGLGKDYAKTAISTPELKPEPKKVVPEVKKQQSTNLVGDGTHDGVPKNAQEYHDAMTKSGKKISMKEAEDTVDSIKYWTGKGSYDIREDQKVGQKNEHADRIDNFIKNSTPFNGEIYRGINFKTEEEAMNWAKGDADGILGNQSAHASWTSDFKIASDFSELSFSSEPPAQVIIKSVNKSGVSIRNLSVFGGGSSGQGVDEKEVVVSRGTRHRVKSVKKENGIIIVETEEVEPPTEGTPKTPTKQEPVKQEKAEAQQQPLGQKVGKLTPSLVSKEEQIKTAKEWYTTSKEFKTKGNKVLNALSEDDMIGGKKVDRELLENRLDLVSDSSIVMNGLISYAQEKPGKQDTIFLKDESGDTQGFFMVGNEKSKDSMYIEFLGTNPSNIIKGKKGVGKQIMYQAIQESIKRGLKGRIKLEALNTSESFYEAVGFQRKTEKVFEDGQYYDTDYFELSEESAKAYINKYKKAVK